MFSFDEGMNYLNGNIYRQHNCSMNLRLSKKKNCWAISSCIIIMYHNIGWLT